MAAGTWVVYRNYRYGDPALQRVNTFLLAAFVGETIFYIFGFGDFSGDMITFNGMLGLSVAINNGVRRRVRAVQPSREMEKPGGFAQLPHSPVPAFQRHRPGTAR